MSDVTIEKNIPIPEKYTRTGKWGLAISGMSVGDSFVTDVKKEQAIRSAAKLQRCMVTMRRIGDGSVRVWLVNRAPKAE